MPTLLTSTAITAIQIKEAASPGTPASGYGRLYFYTDNTLHIVADTGTDINITGLYTGAIGLASQAAGDIMYASGAGQWVRLVKGTASDVLVSDGSVPSWSKTTGITAVGTIATGVWQGTSIGTTYTDAKVTAVASRTGSVTLDAADIGAGTFTGAFTFASTITGSISGNAATVTAGVYTSGSYANPAWLTAVAGTILSGTTLATGIVTSSLTTVGTLVNLTVTNTITGSISGNAATVTDGVYTSGSYADPAWITSLAASKVGLGSVENTALSTWAGTTNVVTLGTVTTGSWNAGAIIVTGADNALALTVTGGSITGSGTAGFVSLAGTWNTSGSPTALKLNVTNTASGASALLADFQASTVTKWNVSKAGLVTQAGGLTLSGGSPTTSIVTFGNSNQFIRIGDDGPAGLYHYTNYGSATAGHRFYGYGTAGNQLKFELANTVFGARVYLAFTNASNYERFAITPSAGTVTLEAETAGTGTDNINIVLTPAGTGIVSTGATFKAGAYQSSDGTAGVSVGPYTTITAITVKDGLITSITGS